MEQQGMILHESIELHEILTFKNLCLTKSIAMSPLVTDNELKTILRQDTATTQRHIEELRVFLHKADQGPIVTVGSLQS
jgi:similar to spore coat protein